MLQDEQDLLGAVAEHVGQAMDGFEAFLAQGLDVLREEKAVKKAWVG